MLNALDTTHLVALAAALGWASGLRLYAVVFLTGAAGFLGWVPLPDGLKVLQTPGGAGRQRLDGRGGVLCRQDPGAWTPCGTLVHTFIRIPAGAALAAGVFGAVRLGHRWATVAGLLGGTLAATAHAAKATTRAAANTSPEPFSNIGLSLLGDMAVPGMLYLAWQHPRRGRVEFFVALALAVVPMDGWVAEAHLVLSPVTRAGTPGCSSSCVRCAGGGCSAGAGQQPVGNCHAGGVPCG